MIRNRGRFCSASRIAACHFPGRSSKPQVFEAASVEQRQVELSTLKLAHVAQRRVADDLLDAAAQLGARHWRRVDRAEILGGRCRRRTWRS
jgi:hypothetical protein